MRGLQTTRSVALAEAALDTELHEEHRAALRNVKPKVNAGLMLPATVHVFCSALNMPGANAHACGQSSICLVCLHIKC